MEKNLNKYIGNFNYLFISFLFSSFIFFWGINFSFLQLRFLIFLLIIPILLNYEKVLYKRYINYFLLLGLIFFHTIFQYPFDKINNLFDIVGFLFLCLIFDIYKKNFFKKIDQIMYIFFVCLFSYILISYFSYENYFIQVSDGCIGCFSILREFFDENSHFGLAVVPSIFYLLFLSKIKTSMRLFLLGLIFILAYLNISITLVAGLLIILFFIIFMNWKNKKLYIYLMLILLLVSFFNKNVLNNINKVSDIFVKNEKINLSSEVYLASLFVTKKALMNKPFGYGFNNYYIAFDEFIEDYEPFNKLVFELNRKDASNNLSKIVTEFGIFSIFYFYFLISFFFKRSIDTKLKLFLIIPLIMQTFVRGVGYFNGGFLLFFIYALFLWKENLDFDYNTK